MVLADNGVVSRWWLVGRAVCTRACGACVSQGSMVQGAVRLPCPTFPR